MRTEEENLKITKEFALHCAKFLGEKKVDLLASLPIVVTVMTDLVESAMNQIITVSLKNSSTEEEKSKAREALNEMTASVRTAISIELDMIEERVKEKTQ